MPLQHQEHETGHGQTPTASWREMIIVEIYGVKAARATMPSAMNPTNGRRFSGMGHEPPCRCGATHVRYSASNRRYEGPRQLKARTPRCKKS
jgi:hypothetical protein